MDYNLDTNCAIFASSFTHTLTADHSTHNPSFQQHLSTVVRSVNPSSAHVIIIHVTISNYPIATLLVSYH